MKRNVISTVILAVEALLAVGCTPENVAPEPQPNETTRNVSYVKCGESGHATVTGDEAWHALLGTLFDAVDEGCEVSFWEVASGSDKPTKESVTYRTASRDSAYAWGERMYDRGYTVSVIFDADSGQYVCSAAQMLFPYSQIPLEQYLPGRWVLDSSVIYSLYNAHTDSTQDWAFFDGHYYFNIAPMPWNYQTYMVYDSINDTWYPYEIRMHEELIITSDSITRPFPLLPGRSLLQHNAMGLIDSTITYHYEIEGSRVLGPTINISLTENDFALWGNTESVSYSLNFEVYQLGQDTMVLYGYVPYVIENYDDVHYFDKVWAFVRQ